MGWGSPIVTTTDGTSEPVVWSVSAETANLLHAFSGETGDELYSSAPGEMSFVRRFQTPIAVNGRIIVAADNRLYVFTTQSGAKPNPNASAAAGATLWDPIF
jgi:hypothetical protein